MPNKYSTGDMVMYNAAGSNGLVTLIGEITTVDSNYSYSIRNLYTGAFHYVSEKQIIFNVREYSYAAQALLGPVYAPIITRFSDV